MTPPAPTPARVFDSWPPADFARCHHATCEVRHNCIRHLYRGQAHARNHIVGAGGPHCPQYTRAT